MIEIKADFSGKENTEPIENEVWVDVIGYKGLYQVSNWARVKSLERVYFCGEYKREVILPEIIMKTSLIKGYPALRLSKDGVKKLFCIHRLVGVHFIENPNKYPCINHKNSIRNDNRIENLEWCTYSYNCEHGFRVGGRVQKKGIDDELSKPFEVTNVLNNIKSIYYSQREAAKALGTSQTSIYRAIRNSKQHKGYLFKTLTA